MHDASLYELTVLCSVGALCAEEHKISMGAAPVFPNHIEGTKSITRSPKTLFALSKITSINDRIHIPTA